MNAYQSIKHDASGFLVGELIETSKAALASQQAGVGILRGIRADVSAISRAMGLASRATSAQQGNPLRVSEPARRASAALGARSYVGRVEIAVPRGRDGAGRFLSSAPGNKTKTAGGDSSDRGGSISDKMGKVADAVKGIARSADNVDPAVTAMGEIKSVLEPLGRGAFALFGRGETQGKERWYSKFLKALTAKKDPAVVSGGGGSGDDGAMAGGIAGLVVRGLPFLLTAIGAALAVGIGAFVGTKLGGLIYEWLDKSGVMTKIFDLIDRAKKIPENINKGFDEVDRTRLSPEQQRRSELTTKFNADGSVTPGDPNPPLAPSQSIDQSVGRFKGHAKNLLTEKLGFSPTDDSNNPLSKEYQDRQKNDRAVKGMSDLTSMRWKNGAREDLTGASLAAGVDPGLVAQIGRFESGFNSKATPTRRDGSKISSAHGYGQFLDGTWTDVVNRYGSKYGVEGAGKLTTEQAGALRNDPKLQAAMLAEFTKENVAKGRANGGKDDAANVYAYHNLGDGDAKRMLSAVKSNPDMSARDALIGGRDIGEKERARIESVISNNKSLYGNGSIPASEAYARMGQKMRDGDSYAADARLLASNGGVARSASGIQVPAAVSVAGLQSMVPANIPSSVPQKLPSSPEVMMPSPSPSEKQRPIVVSSNTPVGQNVSDRTIAHTASGGIGSEGRW